MAQYLFHAFKNSWSKYYLYVQLFKSFTEPQILKFIVSVIFDVLQQRNKF